ncbi:hypothetical protein PP568_25170 [Mycobacteroides abscessus]|uniref:Lipoprotein n=1 Tax=Mycobacteroides abscessus subsp. abscessus TaxID=1185650 RepID=A0AB38D7S3_9MYCO|nr:hypothetical protein [Mycobacteroides abscessus]MBE5423478.1 hypothetical protein [Mycobacteroides abscessus]MBE5458314.1 hypothetical protein [Mycobacteroides abscessus]MBN7459176.1 hypothetical protein [Mycobacteroides abscessus subsp. abscessus]MBN7557539.1 hypothetical protein [Mycobacteroides abscessus subsp. abscessus]MDM2407586.1 hypothetical protein [Mycobacteroides abscessus]
MATNRIAGALTALLVLTAISGCRKPAEPTPSPPEDKQQYSTRWIPNPSLDLMTPEGTFVRAISESYWSAGLSYRNGRLALADKGYPGVEHAENNVFDGGNLGYLGGDSSQPVVVGTAYYEVVEFRRDSNRYTATVCDYSGQTAQKERDGSYGSRGSTPTGITKSYTFGPDPSLTPDQQHAPPAQQRGPARRPTDNVFGTWLLFEEPRVSDEQRRVCDKLAPGTPPDWPDIYKRSEPPPTLPPDPGWPEGSSA